jgi:hypothetical protein
MDLQEVHRRPEVVCINADVLRAAVDLELSSQHMLSQLKEDIPSLL